MTIVSITSSLQNKWSTSLKKQNISIEVPGLILNVVMYDNTISRKYRIHALCPKSEYIWLPEQIKDYWNCTVQMIKILSEVRNIHKENIIIHLMLICTLSIQNQNVKSVHQTTASFTPFLHTLKFVYIIFKNSKTHTLPLFRPTTKQKGFFQSL